MPCKLVTLNQIIVFEKPSFNTFLQKLASCTTFSFQYSFSILCPTWRSNQVFFCNFSQKVSFTSTKENSNKNNGVVFFSNKRYLLLGKFKFILTIIIKQRHQNIMKIYFLKIVQQDGSVTFQRKNVCISYQIIFLFVLNVKRSNVSFKFRFWS